MISKLAQGLLITLSAMLLFSCQSSVSSSKQTSSKLRESYFKGAQNFWTLHQALLTVARNQKSRGALDIVALLNSNSVEQIESTLNQAQKENELSAEEIAWIQQYVEMLPYYATYLNNSENPQTEIQFIELGVCLLSDRLTIKSDSSGLNDCKSKSSDRAIASDQKNLYPESTAAWNALSQKIIKVPQSWKQFIVLSQDSKVRWIGKKYLGKHWGNVSVTNSAFYMNQSMPTAGSVVIDLNSLTVSDIKGEWENKIIRHLKSEDFFFTEKYQNASFQILAIRKLKGEMHSIGGVLHLRGKSKFIVAEANIKNTTSNIKIKGSFTFDRTDFGIVYNSPSVTGNLGDKLIYDDVNIEFEFVAKEQESNTKEVANLR